MAAETNDHKRGGLKHYRFILQLRNRTQASLGRNWGVGRHVFRVEALEEDPRPSFASFRRPLTVFGLRPLFPSPKPAALATSHLSLALTRLPPSSQDLVITPESPK